MPTGDPCEYLCDYFPKCVCGGHDPSIELIHLEEAERRALEAVQEAKDEVKEVRAAIRKLKRENKWLVSG